ncbi:Pollen Ole e 1 allergen/extensin [Artemisia annua]|nr:Pollen Ole e 1 allergen/extensin [Artemisia annua]
MVFLCLLALLVSSFLIQETKAAAHACDPTDPNCVISPSRKKPVIIEGTRADEEADRAKVDDKPEIVIVGASIAVSCDTNRKMSKSDWVRGRTDEYGDFFIDLPSHLHAVPNMEEEMHSKSFGATKELFMPPSFYG